MTDPVCYDPRDSEQDIKDRSTWKPLSNPALIALTYAIDIGAEIENLDAWREQADYCEQTVEATASEGQLPE